MRSSVRQSSEKISLRCRVQSSWQLMFIAMLDWANLLRTLFSLVTILLLRMARSLPRASDLLMITMRMRSFMLTLILRGSKQTEEGAIRSLLIMPDITVWTSLSSMLNSRISSLRERSAGLRSFLRIRRTLLQDVKTFSECRQQAFTQDLRLSIVRRRLSVCRAVWIRLLRSLLPSMLSISSVWTERTSSALRCRASVRLPERRITL